MILSPHGLAALRERWLSRRNQLDGLGALVDGARLCDELLADLERAAADDNGELLSLRDAAIESGYSADHLGRMLRAGVLPNAGRVNAPKIRRSELPRKANVLRPTAASRTIPISKRRIARACVTLSDNEARDG